MRRYATVALTALVVMVIGATEADAHRRARKTRALSMTATAHCAATRDRLTERRLLTPELSTAADGGVYELEPRGH